MSCENVDLHLDFALTGGLMRQRGFIGAQETSQSFHNKSQMSSALNEVDHQPSCCPVNVEEVENGLSVTSSRRLCRDVNNGTLRCQLKNPPALQTLGGTLLLLSTVMQQLPLLPRPRPPVRHNLGTTQTTWAGCTRLENIVWFRLQKWVFMGKEAL